MARFSKTELQNYIEVTKRVEIELAIDAALPSQSALTAESFRDSAKATAFAILSTMWESMRQLPSVSPANATMFEIGSNPDNWFDIELLDEGNGGLVLPDGDPAGSGFKLVPIVTGNGTQTNPESGAAFESNPFDGVTEISLGSGATANMFKIDYDGYWDVVASCKPAPLSNQNNREIEIDLWVFDGTGAPKRSIGFIASANQGSNQRTFTQSIPRSTLNEAFLGDDEWIGLVIRRYEGEQVTSVRLQKAFVQVSLVGLGE